MIAQLLHLSSDDKVLVGIVVTVLVAPTWLGWWNSRTAKKQVTPNGGNSLKDQITTIAVNQLAQDVKLDTISEVQGKHTEEIKTIKTVQSDMLGRQKVILHDVNQEGNPNEVPQVDPQVPGAA
jgi:hypothetical protein